MASVEVLCALVPAGLPDRGNCHAPERTCGRFGRMVRLPDGTDVRAATTVFEDGVLEIRSSCRGRDERPQSTWRGYAGPPEGGPHDRPGVGPPVQDLAIDYDTLR